MSFTYPDARTWAKEHSLADQPRLGRLEGVAFQRYPHIVELFGSDGAAMAAHNRRAKRPSRLRSIGGVFLGAIAVAFLVAPAAGVAFYGEVPPHVAPTTDPISVDTAVKGSAVSFMVAAALQLALWAAWIKGGRNWSPAMLGISVYSGIAAGFASAGLQNRASRDGFADVQRWMWPLWLTLVLSLTLILAILLRRHSKAPVTVEENILVARPAAAHQARTAIRNLPAQELQAILVDRDAALSVLAERGLLSPEALDKARSMDIGTLYLLDGLTH